MSTLWNPADKTAGTTLSSSNHIATGSAGNQGVRSSPVTHGSGKWYFELTGITVVGGSGSWGTANSTTTLGAAGDIYVDPGGNFNFITGTSNPGGGSPAGHTVSFAIDYTAKRCWVRYDAGSWFGSAVGDPALGTNGADCTGFGAVQSIYAWLQNGGTAHINAGDVAFAQSVPSGFTAWDNTPPFSPSQCAVLS